MNQPFIQSIKEIDTKSLDQELKIEPVSKEAFQMQLAKETKKQETEKENNFNADSASDKVQDESKKNEVEAEKILFSHSFLPIQSEITDSLKTSSTTVALESNPEFGQDYIKAIDEIGIENKTKQVITASLNDDESSINIRDHLPANPMDDLVRSEDEWSNQLVETETISDKSKLEMVSVKQTGKTLVLDNIVSPRLLTKDWTQVKPITELETLIADSKISLVGNEQPQATMVNEAEINSEIKPLLPSETDEPITGAEQVGDKSTVLDKDNLLVNKKSSPTIAVDEKESGRLKSEELDSKVKLDTSVAVQKNTSELIVTKTSNQDTIRQKVTYEVNQLISKESEQVQAKGQSSAKVTISPEGMGDISISLELKDHVLSTKIIVDSLKVQELLTGGVPKLSDNLNQHSIQIGEVSIQLASSEQQGSLFDQKQHKKEQQIKKNTPKGSYVESAPKKVAPEANGTLGRLSILV